jgi:tetratricopeptide (TPR) repeat protein
MPFDSELIIGYISLKDMGDQPSTGHGDNPEIKSVEGGLAPPQLTPPPPGGTPPPVVQAAEFKPKEGFLEGAGTILGGGCVTLTGAAYGFYNLVYTATGKEALREPAFWFAIGGLWLLGAVSATFLARQKPYRVIDLIIAAGLAVVAATCLIVGQLVWKSERPSVSVYRVGYFDSETREGTNFLEHLVPQLEELKKEELKDGIILDTWPIDHKPIREGDEKTRTEDILSWARRRGCHLAIAEVRDSRAHKIRILEVSHFGNYINPDALNLEIELPEEIPDSAGDARISVAYQWGLAKYRRGEYDDAIRLLQPIDRGAAQFVAGSAWFLKSRGGLGVLNCEIRVFSPPPFVSTAHAFGGSDISDCLDNAEARFTAATESETGMTALAAMYHFELGQTLVWKLILYLVSDVEAALQAAGKELELAAQIFHARGQAGNEAYAKTTLASAYLRPDLLKRNVPEAERLLRDALGGLGGDHLIEAQSDLEFVLSQAPNRDRSAAERDCAEVKTLHESVEKGAKSTATMGKDATALGACAAITADGGLFSEAKSEFQHILVQIGESAESAIIHFEFAVTLLNYAANARDDLPRHDTLEQAADEYTKATNSFGRLSRELKCMALAGRAKARFLQAEQSRGGTRLSSLKHAVEDVDAIESLRQTTPACGSYADGLSHWARPARAELELRGERRVSR